MNRLEVGGFGKGGYAISFRKEMHELLLIATKLLVVYRKIEGCENRCGRSDEQVFVNTNMCKG